ncbi:transferrin-binding protein-like solute binding protein [uncultured Haemophilus sp.]|uniref:transferrin-binding protein-like solute binding protein n=1 Tax=uncultured Haemophilus sp. TaxID=237779 RepID=UPI0025CB9194|nr:transferrin-binding protein-like solute binding protein [uncultured Haemophilus sp.]
MRKVTLSALAIALAMGLSACSSSQEESNDPSSNDVATFQPNKSSSENNSSNQSASENNSSNQSSSENDSANQTNESGRPSVTPIEKGPLTTTSHESAVSNAIPTIGKFNGIAYEFKSNNENDKIVNPKVHQLSTDDINVLNINGKRIDIAPEGVNPGYTYLEKDGEIRLSTGAFVNGKIFQGSMQNGIYQSQKDGKTYVYIQGELTPTDNIPKRGTASYFGLSSYHVDNRTLRESSIDIDVAVDKPPRFNVMGVDMTANFEDKTVKGRLLHTAALNNVQAELEGTISGNQFSGTKNDTKLQGAFFGEKANEMGGVYINEKEGFSGAFSAKSKW